MMRRALISALILVVFFACTPEESIQGDHLFRTGDYQAAIAAYTKVLESKPFNIKAIYNRGRSYEELSQFDQALQDFERVVELDPKHVQGYLSIGNYYFRLENHDQAAFNYEKAVKNDEGSADAHLLFGKALHKMGEVDQAMEAYTDAISINDRMGEAYLFRGILNTVKNRNAKACNDFKTAKALGEEDAEEALKKYCR